MPDSNGRRSTGLTTNAGATTAMTAVGPAAAEAGGATHNRLKPDYPGGQSAHQAAGNDLEVRLLKEGWLKAQDRQPGEPLLSTMLRLGLIGS